MGKIVLVTGGVRSGKSAFAERYTAYCAAQTGTKVAYIATAQVYDEEMRQRVDLHQSRRPADWSTYEAPFHTEDAIRAAGAAHGVILFDCITMFLSNDMLQYPEEEQERDSFVLHVEKRIGALISAAQERMKWGRGLCPNIAWGVFIGIWRDLPISRLRAVQRRSISSPVGFR